MKNSLKEQAKSLPLSPGVYLMKDRHGEVIYVGKAKKLQERVSSYFVKNKQHSKKTLRLIHQLTDFDVIEVTTELDALLLECQLIHKYRPIYNRQMNAFEKYKYIEINTQKKDVTINILTVPTYKNCFGPFPINRKLSELKGILEDLYGLNQKNYWQQSFSNDSPNPIKREIIVEELLGAFAFNNQQPQNRLKEKMILASERYSFEQAKKIHENWKFITHFFTQNKKLILANQTQWQLLYIAIGAKIKYYLIYQGLVVNSRTLTKQTFNKYTSTQLVKKILPKKRPENRNQFSKEQVDFINILYSYVNQHRECQLIDLTDPFA
ncbi:GIY-YIG nuclease family protein [Enterococcus quebecensis]|uniref:Excinuclease ABC n=1 Tax=Enterococcus quebecensis TaxID=903983 RepID=A0A1E5H3G4_9ENTE|nr:GIY-YIG nuclease family protein [Enterococcus quebecensis]OEG19432.1 excinuclease ABC [Enterococcus quebecensis]OJG75296.1 hypothetical protein RV12_GL001901 [Enterococcus quebecensis]